jgi:hypothetical protein
VNVSPARPWELNPVLEQDRLALLAHAAVATRNRAFAEADRAAGDTNWGLACKAHERLIHVLGTLAGSGEHPWLTVVRDGLYVMPHIDGVPVRLYRGAPDRPGARHLEALRLEHEHAQQPARPQMAFDFMDGSAGGPWYWLMAMETDAAGMVTRVVFVQANDAGETRNAWECPLDKHEKHDEVEPAPASEKRMVQAAAVAPAAVVADEGGGGAPRRGRRSATKPAAPRQEALWGAIGAE